MIWAPFITIHHCAASSDFSFQRTPCQKIFTAETSTGRIERSPPHTAPPPRARPPAAALPPVPRGAVFRIPVPASGRPEDRPSLGPAKNADGIRPSSLPIFHSDGIDVLGTPLFPAAAIANFGACPPTLAQCSFLPILSSVTGGPRVKGAQGGRLIIGVVHATLNKYFLDIAPILTTECLIFTPSVGTSCVVICGVKWRKYELSGLVLTLTYNNN